MITFLLIATTIASAAAGSQDATSERAGAGTAANGDSGALTLPEALSMALRQSPALTAFTWDIRAADAMIVQAGLRPNPELSIEVEEVRWTPGPLERTRTTTLSGILNPSVAGEREQGEGAHSGFSESEFTNRFGAPPSHFHGDTIIELVSLGLLESYDDCLRLTPRGRMMGNEVFSRFFA